MYELTVKADFSAAHALRGYEGKCARVHGHNFELAVVVAGEELDRCGMLMDFVDLKARLKAVTEELDHQNLNELPPFAERNPTAENIARYLHDRLAEDMPGAVWVASVTVGETCRAAATYRPAPRSAP